jgi:integrase
MDTRRREMVKRRAESAGIDPETVSGHSLRAGLATSAAAAGVSERAIAATTGHKSMTALRATSGTGAFSRRMPRPLSASRRHRENGTARMGTGQ